MMLSDIRIGQQYIWTHRQWFTPGTIVECVRSGAGLRFRDPATEEEWFGKPSWIKPLQSDPFQFT